MIHIPHIQLEFLLPADGIASMALRPSGDSRADLMSPGLFWTVKGQILRQEGSRSDQGHITFQHVDELREFVNRSRTDKLPDPGQPLLIRQQITIRIPLIRHGLELDDMENPGILSGTGLQKESSGALIGEMEPKRNQEEKPSDQEKGGQGDQEIEQSFEKMPIHDA